ncbi:MAG: response regulator, partial [Planctomycetes bacterium]|nr:response regulator [Planctomycetota bacterium]
MPEINPFKRRVLIADDTPQILELLKRILVKAGFEVETAVDGMDALDKVLAFNPDLMFLDIMMPRVHGIDVLKQLKENSATSHIGVIMCSARNFKSDSEQAMELGAFDFLVKPFEKEQVLTLVEAFFSRRLPPLAAPSAVPVVGGASSEVYAPDLDLSLPYWRLWGTRGSIPVPGHKVARHGGNTSCLEVRSGDDLVVIDAGTGIRELGIEIAKGGPRHIPILIGHTHWDHIQGFPFFAPAYIPGFSLTLYGASGFRKDLRSVFQGQLDRDYFPVELKDMSASLDFKAFESNPIKFGSISVAWDFTNHPGATVCFRVDVGGKRIAYVTDNEFLQGFMGKPHDLTPDSDVCKPYQRTIEFVKGCDLLIAEAQYSPTEYPKKIGWGHTSLANACLLA